MNVKICGITSIDDAREAVRVGATHIGFIFDATSPRYVTPAAAAQIAQALPRGVGKVGVFVNQPAEVVQSTMRVAGLDIAQLHGDETPELCRTSARRVWKVLRVSQASDRERERLVAKAATFAACECMLVDAKADKAFGGTGRLSDWQLAAELGRRHKVVLAGGLNPRNVAEAVKTVRPWAIDVSSGVEMGPGKKDKAKMEALFAALRVGA